MLRAATIFGVIFTAQFALATPPDAKELVAEASRLYGDKQFIEAAQVLERARALSPAGRIIFNLARAYERAGNTERARKAYQDYLSQPDTEPIAVLRAREALELVEPRQPLPPSTTPLVPVSPVEEVKPPPPPPTPALTAPSLVQAAPPTPSPTTRPLRIVGLALVGAGGAALATGVGVGVWANDTATRARGTFDPVEKPSLRADAIGQATAADVVIVSGSVLAVVGAVLLVVDALR